MKKGLFCRKASAPKNKRGMERKLQNKEKERQVKTFKRINIKNASFMPHVMRNSAAFLRPFYIKAIGNETFNIKSRHKNEKFLS